MEKQVYHCPKCGCTSFEHDQFQATAAQWPSYSIYRTKNSSPFPVQTVGLPSCTVPRHPPAKMCWIFLINA